MPTSFSFATFLIVCPTSFFLGIVFAQFPYDYPLLWSSAQAPSSHYDMLEAHLKLLHASPNLITRILHIMLSAGLLGLFVKLYKPSESNMLFDGGSLVLYMVAVIVYIANIVKGLRIVTTGIYGMQNLNEMSEEQLDTVDSLGNDIDSGNSILGREDNLKVLSASNTILALVLVGVLVLQIGQWYAERAEEKAQQKYLADQKKAEAEAAGSDSGRKSSGSREAKKTR